MKTLWGLGIMCCLSFADYANAVASTPFSQHGLLNNVQNYSSNPFWNPNAPYNQRMPTPVYAQGTGVKAPDCQALVAAQVAQQCAIRNNCANTKLSDIRPAMIIALSQLPGANYATACAGYIDVVFDDYKKAYAGVANVQMPTIVTPNAPAPTVSYESQPQVPTWASDIMARQAILQAAQQSGNANGLPAQPTDFSTTYADLSFADRMENEKTGYEPYKDKSAYVQIELESEEEYMVRQAELQRQNALLKMPKDKYCDMYPLDDEYCPQTPGLYESVLAIADKPATKQEKQPVQQGQTSQQTQPATSTSQQTQSATSTSQQTATSTTTPVATAQAGSVVGVSEDGRNVVSSPRIHDGPCTLPQRSKAFVNKILTTGNYAKTDPAFEKIMITTFRAEGECGQLKGDTGGYTCYGISQNNNPDIDVKNITRADAENIANKRYYKSVGIEKLPDYIRLDVFTFGWASGITTGIYHLCDVLNLPRRKKIDAEIVAAVENYSGDLREALLENMKQHFINVSKKGQNRRFLKGWMNRVQLTRENGCHYRTTEPISR